MATNKQQFREEVASAPTDDRGEQLCPECSGQVITEACEIVCEDCGLVIDNDRIDHGPEWRKFEIDSKERTHSITDTRNDDGFGSVIRFNNENSDTKNKRQLKRAKVFERRAKAKKHKMQGHLLGAIKRACSAIELSDTGSDTACRLFKQFHEQQDNVGYCLEEMGAASVYAAARIEQAPVLKAEVCEQFDVDERGLFNELKRLQEELSVTIPLKSPESIVPRLVSELDGCVETESIARELASQAVEAGIDVGKKPTTVAAAVVYAAFKESPVEQKLKQETVADVAGVSVGYGIRPHWQAMKEHGITS